MALNLGRNIPSSCALIADLLSTPFRLPPLLGDPLGAPSPQAVKNTRPSSTLLQRSLVRTAMQESSPEGYAQACEMISRTGSSDWSKIVAPVLVIAGREDQISSLKAAEEVAGCLVEARSVKVVQVEAGHQPAVECPEVVLSLLEEFMGV